MKRVMLYFEKKNRGVAMISVMICVMFITLLASTLLYMATLNMKMKGARYLGTDNFYTAEFALSDMLGQLRQTIDGKDDVPQTIKDEFKQASGDYYDESKLQDLIHLKAASGGDDLIEGLDTVEVSCIYASGSGYSRKTLVSDSTGVYFYGVHVMVRTTSEKGAYESSITTDIHLKSPVSVDQTSKINDFSILADVPLYVSAGCHYLGGNLYVHANGNSTVGSGTALRVGEHGICVLLCNYAFIDGDLVVDNGGTLIISGRVLVNGNLNLASKGTLYNSGTIEVKGTGPSDTANGMHNAGTYNKGTSSTVDWDFYDIKAGDACPQCQQRVAAGEQTWTGKLYENDAKTKLVCCQETHPGDASTGCGYSQGNYANGLGKTLFVDQLQIPTSSGVVYKNFTDLVKQFSGNDYKTHDSFANIDGQTSKDVWAGVKTQNATHQWSNALVISAMGMDLDSNQNFQNCTYLNVCQNEGSAPCLNLKINDKSNFWGNMTDESFAAAKELFFAHGNMGTNYGAPAEGARIGDITPDGSDWKYGSNTLSCYGTGPYSPLYEDASNKVMYVAFGNIFANDSQATLSKFMTGSDSSGGDEGGYVIVLENWMKE